MEAQDPPRRRGRHSPFLALRLYRRRLGVTVSGPGLDANQYFKFGPYRASGQLPWSVSYDDFRRGPRCSDVIRLGQCPAERADLSKAIGKTELSTSSDRR